MYERAGVLLFVRFEWSILGGLDALACASLSLSMSLSQLAWGRAIWRMARSAPAEFPNQYRPGRHNIRF